LNHDGTTSTTENTHKMKPPMDADERK